MATATLSARPTESSPTPSPSLTPAHTPAALPCWSEGGSVEAAQVESTRLSKPLNFVVYLPPCYTQQPERDYPTLYLLHGQTYTEDQWLRLGIDLAANALIASQEIPPLIVVMPGEQDHYTPPPENPYGRVLVDELMPYIDSKYRTLTERGDRAIGGLSRGGNWAVYLGLTEWQHFGAIGGHSAPSFVTNGPSHIREWLDNIPAESLPRIYLDAGKDDGWRHYMIQLEHILTEENIPHEWHLYQGAHQEDYWAKHVEEYLRWYTEMW